MIGCATCGCRGAHHGRGLCRACYLRHWKRGTLDAFPRRFWKATDLVAEVRFLLAAGESAELVPGRLGTSAVAVSNAARAMGDHDMRRLFDRFAKREERSSA